MSTQPIKTLASIGLENCEIQIEADQSKGLPKIEIIGLPDAAIRESKERIRSSFRNCELPLPPRRLIVNLAPSNVRKVGTRFDLPIAVALLVLLQGTNYIEGELNRYYFGELGLDGSIKRVVGLLPSVIAAYKAGVTEFVIPADNLAELQYIHGITLYPVSHFSELIDHFSGTTQLSSIQGAGQKELPADLKKKPPARLDDIRGHPVAKKALSIAAAGMHNLLLVGPPGSGKSLLAKSLQSLLPPLTFEEILEVSQIYSVTGLLDADLPLITQRPYRTVHHTASKVSIVGGGQLLTPGEVSLAHLGVLFFDELTEFPRQVLEVLRQPLEDKSITISRAHGTVNYPADVMFVAAMNPCKCGFYKDPDKACTCSHYEVSQYQQRISGPLLDRFDMVVEVPREKVEVVMGSKETSHEHIYEQVMKARHQQYTRYTDSEVALNSQLHPNQFDELLDLEPKAKEFLIDYANQFHISPRVIHKLCKVARTIADMNNSPVVTKKHIAEAVFYRGKSMFVSG